MVSLYLYIYSGTYSTPLWAWNITFVLCFNALIAPGAMKQRCNTLLTFQWIGRKWKSELTEVNVRWVILSYYCIAQYATVVAFMWETYLWIGTLFTLYWHIATETTTTMHNITIKPYSDLKILFKLNNIWSHK